ncbi:anhydro-N-acetylmuramic acid kinase [Sulfurovum lithotrophicum]|uniref:Anhydro-N-acetylmuramic acid kinase n=1 Tax=Sulfurovum lithotrophicum TaxID=206403 RepID=A0A7U4M0R1_9BACT|nr:anhydro-N-acetylmuramic acid kinase [Sulfurovum lithotrophicum]AKF24749.1 anhydro-N-acetylmuramic acid kinase [Sulfurovum lithotrophicum]
MNKEHYIGIMSGTSMDGVDVVLCEIDKQSCLLKASLEYPFPSDLKDEMHSMISGECTLAEVGTVDVRLAILFSDAVNTLLEQEHIDPQSIKAIGSHGQTLWHEPEGMYPFSMQLGDPSTITVRTGIKVVADFRQKDMALGGQGAPFAPAFHAFLFGNTEATESYVSILNMGGMANITVLGKTLLGYDTGPGNVLMDMWIAEHKDVTYDRNGEWARSGEVIYPLLEAMLEDPYFSQPYPKSTGREKFNKSWLEKGLNPTLQPQDIQRTLLELTAISISNEVLKFNPDLLMLCGGGAKNSFLVERLAALMPNIQVGVMENADTLEAMTFAWLAYKRLHNEHVDLKDVTGARRNAVLGGVYV